MEAFSLCKSGAAATCKIKKSVSATGPVSAGSRNTAEVGAFISFLCIMGFSTHI